jgi:diguanylate cyclase (GGDEF)-like protein
VTTTPERTERTTKASPSAGRVASLLRGVLLCVLAFCCSASARELDFAKVGQETVNLNEYASWAQETSGALSFDLARSDTGPLRFVESPGAPWDTDFRRSESAYWVKLPIFNSGTKPQVRLLAFAQPLLETVDVYCESPDGSLRTTKTGHALAFDTRPYPHRLLIVPLELGPREGQTVWLRIRSPYATDLHAQLWERNTFQIKAHADAMQFGWLLGLCAVLALVFVFMWGATGQKAFALFLAVALAQLWRMSEHSGLLATIGFWSGNSLASRSFVLADTAALLATVALLLHGLGASPAHRLARRSLQALFIASLALPLLLAWPMAAATARHYAVPMAFSLMVLLCAVVALRGERAFLWYGLSLAVPAVSLYFQHLPDAVASQDIFLSTASFATALAQGLVVLAGAVAYGEVRKRQAHMRELRDLLQAQNLALDKARQAEIDLESQVSQRTQELAMAARRLEALSTVDGMTGVANRRRFDETLQVEWGRAARDKRPLSVALIDVDWFKSYNDRYGHPAGDACLRQLARVFEAGVMRSGDLIARYGGEEFVLIAPDTDLNGIHTIASYLCQEVFALALEHEDSPYGRVSVSIGVATAYPHRGSKPLQLVQQADAALYRAKNQGRHRVVGPEVQNEKV